jgi:hypothetical protein
MSRFLVIFSATVLFGLASPVALADAPGDAPQARADAPDLKVRKKKKSGAKKSSSAKKPQPARSTPQRSAPRHASAPGNRPGAQQGSAGQQAPVAQQPAQQAPTAQRPAQQAPSAHQPATHQAPSAQQAPAAQRPTQAPSAQPGAAQARPTTTGTHARPSNPGQQGGTVHPVATGVKPGTAMSARPTGHATAGTHRSVHRPPAANIAGAQRHAQQSGAAHHNHKQHARASAKNHRVQRAHAQARHAQQARHRHHAHASHAHRAYYARHHRHNHGWNWYHRPWWRSHSYYNPWYRPHWAYGVFIYGPRPVHHTVYVADQPAEVAQPQRRAVDRSQKWAVGLRGGGYLSGYEHGPGFNDFGMGLTGRYRAAESLGFELAWAHHDQTWTEDTNRWSEPLSASVQLFGLPWTRFNPYVSAGITWTDRSYRDSYTDRYGSHVVSEDHVIFGPHGGLGLELGLGDNASVNVEARMMGYLNIEDDDRALPTALQTQAGVNFYF